MNNIDNITKVNIYLFINVCLTLESAFRNILCEEQMN